MPFMQFSIKGRDKNRYLLQDEDDVTRLWITLDLKTLHYEELKNDKFIIVKETPVHHCSRIDEKVLFTFEPELDDIKIDISDIDVSVKSPHLLKMRT